MQDFFKELNIIDILGIGLPGCLLVLLLGGDQTAKLLWAEQFGGNTLAFASVLIAAGSLVGMLIQELGDLIEKGLWMDPSLDPKCYAAYAVNTNDLQLDDLTKRKYQEPENSKTIEFLSKLAALAVVLCASLLLPVAVWYAADGTGGSIWEQCPALLGLLPLAFGAYIAKCLLPVVAQKKKKSEEKGKTEDQPEEGANTGSGKKQKLSDKELENIQTIRAANPYIQTRLVGHGNASKRTLFDGWRFVMRNLVLVLAIANLISICKPLDLYRQVAEIVISDNGSGPLGLFVLTCFASFAILMMLVRYYHYAYLRYKYSLEDYILLVEEEDQGK